MKLKKLSLFVALTLATGFIVGCGDDKDPTISDWGRRCLKIMEYGGKCNPNSEDDKDDDDDDKGTTKTQTVTITQTQTSS